MYVKKIKRICGVRGCKNTDVFALSKTREMGNSVIICKDCLKDALASVDNYVEPVKVKKEISSLFYHPELEVTPSSVAVNEEEPKPVEVIDKTAEVVSVSVAGDDVTITEEPKPVTEKPKTTNSKKPNKKK